jgi:hypothetical protein
MGRSHPKLSKVVAALLIRLMPPLPGKNLTRGENFQSPAKVHRIGVAVVTVVDASAVVNAVEVALSVVGVCGVSVLLLMYLQFLQFFSS